jgi:hypothetical protein
MLFTCHVTAVFVAPVTVAVNDCVLPALTFAEVGATTTLITGGVVPTPAPPHPHTNIIAANVPASAHGILRFITATPVQYLCKPMREIKVLLFSRVFSEFLIGWNFRYYALQILRTADISIMLILLWWARQSVHAGHPYVLQHALFQFLLCPRALANQNRGWPDSQRVGRV